MFREFTRVMVFSRRYTLSMNNVTQSSMCVDPPSDDESWRSDVSSCISCSSSPMPLYGGHNKRLSKHHHTNRSWTNKRRNEHNQRLTSLVCILIFSFLKLLLELFLPRARICFPLQNSTITSKVTE